MKFPPFTRVLPVDIRILKSNDKRFQNFKSMKISFIVPCFGVIDYFFSGDVAVVFVNEVFLDGA